MERSSKTAPGRQISLGKEIAGRTVVIDSNEPGIWVIKTAQSIPDGELWLHQAAAAETLESSPYLH